MNNISLENFPKIFDIDSVEDIEQQRQKKSTCPFEWKNQAPIVSSCEELKLTEGQFRYTVVHHDVPFECLFFPAKSKNIVVSFCGGGRNNSRYPSFLRWKQYHYYQANYLCVEDPMYFIYKNNKSVCWYYGDKDHDFSAYVEDILKQFLYLLNIAYENIIFLGSSGGGSMSIRMANKFNGSCSIAMNPQFKIGTWHPDNTAWFQKNLQVDLIGEDILGRHTVYPDKNDSRFFLLLNSASPRDCDQFMPFLNHKGIPLQYGISQFNNIVTWIHHSKGTSPHSSNPEKEAIPLLIFINEEMKKGKDINGLNGISLILNEYLNMSYSNQKELKDFIRESKNINNLCINVFNFIRYWFMSKICFGRRRKHYKSKVKCFTSKTL